MKGLLTPIPDGHYELKFFVVDDARNSVAAFALEQSGNKKEALSMLEKGLPYLPNPDDSTPSTGYIDISPAVYKKINKLYKACNPLY